MLVKYLLKKELNPWLVIIETSEMVGVYNYGDQ